jgi:transmembrane sensor
LSNNNLLVNLIEKFRKRALTETERKKLEERLANVKNKDSFYKLLHDPSWILKDLRLLSRVDIDKGWNKVLTEVSASKTVIRRRNNYFSYAIAAAILSCCFILLLINTASKKVKGIPVSSFDLTKIRSGTGAVLVLHDGRYIVLDTCKNGFLCQQGNTRISFKNSKIIYEALPGIAPHTEPLYNQIITYMEGPYQIMLPDNSQVWLNAASSIKLPVAFYNAERHVEITGEAFFDVAHMYDGNRLRKFIVHVNNHFNRNMKVEVIGTRFNINAYDQQENIKTTLLEGRIKISCTDSNVLLMPGEQAQSYEKAIVIKKGTDTSETIGWKEGYFKFSKQSLQTILIEIARWHGLSVEFIGVDRRDIRFEGAIPHNASLEDIIRLMESVARCNIYYDGKRLIVRFR